MEVDSGKHKQKAKSPRGGGGAKQKSAGRSNSPPPPTGKEESATTTAVLPTVTIQEAPRVHHVHTNNNNDDDTKQTYKDAKEENEEAEMEEIRGAKAPRRSLDSSLQAESNKRRYKHSRKKSLDSALHSGIGKVKRQNGKVAEKRSSPDLESLHLEEEQRSKSPKSKKKGKKPTHRKASAEDGTRSAPLLGTGQSGTSEKQSSSKSRTTKKNRNVHHYFVLRIEEAKNLRKSDMLLGRSDPYCYFDIIPAGIIGARTATIRRTLNPQWREQFVGHRYFGLDGEPKPKSFVITVMDYNSLSADAFLGKATIPFTESFDRWFPLEGERAEGKIRIVLTFFTSEDGRELAKILKEETDIQSMEHKWAEAVNALNERSEDSQQTKRSAAGESEAAGTSTEEPAEGVEDNGRPCIPVWDMPCFLSIDKIWTPFQYAVSKDNMALASFLAKECSCNINARDQTGNTALHIAAVKRLNVRAEFTFSFSFSLLLSSQLCI
ncbi:E3 ubiquitin-protein ligase nedd4, variant 2 [Balamuthia mandrillaris]